MIASRSLALAFVGIAALAACSHSAATPEPMPTPMATMSKGPALPSGVTMAMVTTGDSIFKSGSCKNCHGLNAKGTARAPDLTDAKWAQISGTYPEIVKIVTDGVPKEAIKMPGAPFGMKPRGGSNLTDDQVRQVAAYVYSISHT